MITVKELIEILEKVEDKDKIIGVELNQKLQSFHRLTSVDLNSFAKSTAIYLNFTKIC